MRSVEMVTSYAEGSAVVGETLDAFDGGRVGAAAANGSGGKAAAPVAGEATRVSKGQLSYGDRELRIDYQRGGAAVVHDARRGRAVRTRRHDAARAT